MAGQVKFRMKDGCEDLTPRKAHPDDAAYDLYSTITGELRPWTRKLLPTGIFLELPDGYEAQVRPRSGLALKKGITILNAPGTIDAGYRGEVGVIAFNSSDETVHIKRGERIAQMVIQKLSEIELVEAETLAESHRGTGGFGSSG